MVYAILSDDHFTSPVQLALSRSTRLLHVEGLVYACGNLTDGFIPQAAMRIVTDAPNVLDAIKELIAVGLWADVVGGFQIVTFDEHQRSKQDVVNGRAKGQERTRRSRQHTRGDHSLCDPGWCRAARSESSDGISNGVTAGISHAVNGDVSDGTLAQPSPAEPNRAEPKARRESARLVSALRSPAGSLRDSPKDEPFFPPQDSNGRVGSHTIIDTIDDDEVQ
jgi:hypothetical protein